MESLGKSCLFNSNYQNIIYLVIDKSYLNKHYEKNIFVSMFNHANCFM